MLQRITQLFRSKDSKDLETYNEYYIGAEVVMQGTLHALTDIFVDGRVQGEITSTGLIEFGTNSAVEAASSARTAIIEGSYSGELIASEEVVVKSSAQISGSIQARDISVQKGAVISASLKTGSK